MRHRIGHRIIAAAVLFLGMAGFAVGQTPTQRFIVSGSAAGQPSAIASAGFQLTKDVSLAYEYISNPSDPTKTRIGSGLANYSLTADHFLPKSLRTKLLIDPSNYILTLQAGAGRTSEAGANGGPRVSHVVGNFGIYGSKPVAAHAQIGVGYKWIVGPGFNMTVRVPVGTVNFTF